MEYRGKLYRALNPVWAKQPLSGQGAALYGGRFNPKGIAALYAGLSPLAAIKEANQVGDLQPTTLVCLDVDLSPVFDARDEAGLARFGLTPADLATPSWRDEMKASGRSRTQRFAEELIAEGFVGLLVKSFARAATQDDMNLVLWRWGPAPPCRVTLVDDEDRLSRLT